MRERERERERKGNGGRYVAYRLLFAPERKRFADGVVELFAFR